MREIKYSLGNIRITDCCWGILFIATWFATFYWALPNTVLPKKYYIYGVLIPFVLSFSRIHQKPLTQNLKITSFFYASLISCSLTLGFSIAHTHTFDICFGNINLTLIWILKLATYIAIFYQITASIISNIKKESGKTFSPRCLPISNKTLFSVFFLSRIVYLILFYPCFLDHDSASMLCQFSPSCLFYDHHPFSIVLLLQLFFQIGQICGNPSIGFMILSLLMFAASSAIMVYIIRISGQIGVNTTVQKTVILVYALFPLFSLINMYDSKDGLFTFAILLFTASLLDINNRIHHKQKIQKHILFINALAALVMSLSRHQGIYIIFFQFILLILLYRNYWKKWCLTFLPVIIIYYTLVSGIYPSLGVAPGSKSEMLGNLFQQSALAIIENPETTSKKDKTTFEDILAIKTDTLNRCFNYTITDPVKFHYRYIPLKSWEVRNNYSPKEEKLAIKNYLFMWCSNIGKYFSSYLYAELNLINGFFYNDGRGALWFCPDWKTHPKLLKEYTFKYNDHFYNITNTCFSKLSKYPISEFIFSKNYYTWFFILGFIFLFSRKDKVGIISFFPLLLSICLFAICPVAASRYMYPLYITAPLFFMYLIHPYGKK